MVTKMKWFDSGVKRNVNSFERHVSEYILTNPTSGDKKEEV